MHLEFLLIRPLRAWRRQESEVCKTLGFPVLIQSHHTAHTKPEKQAAGQDSAFSDIGKSSGSGDMKIKSYLCRWSTPTKTIASQMLENPQLFAHT